MAPAHTSLITDELFVLFTESRAETFIKIPAPKDPVLRAEWERGVAARKAAGLGTAVGDYD